MGRLVAVAGMATRLVVESVVGAAFGIERRVRRSWRSILQQ